MSMQVFTKLLADFGASAGIPGLAVDDEGYCILKLDEKIVLVMQYEHETESIVLYADLGKYPQAGEHAVFYDILQANCLWTGTGGATLGVNAGTNSVLMCYRLPARHLDTGIFEQTIESLANTAEFWTNRIEALGHRASMTEPVFTGIRV